MGKLNTHLFASTNMANNYTRIRPDSPLNKESKLSECLTLLDQLELALSHATARKEIGLVESMACMEKLDQVTKCIEQSINLLNQKAK